MRKKQVTSSISCSLLLPSKLLIYFPVNAKCYWSEMAAKDKDKDKDKDFRLVYSSDPKLNLKCPKCKELVSECTCPKEVDVKDYKFVAVLRMEKSGRGGKTVTVIDQLPNNEIFT